MDKKKKKLLEIELKRKKIIEQLLHQNQSKSSIIEPTDEIFTTTIHEDKPSTSSSPVKSNIRPISKSYIRSNTVDDDKKLRGIKRRKTRPKKDEDGYNTSSSEITRITYPRPKTSGFRPRTGKERKKDSIEDLDKTVESIIASVENNPQKIEVINELEQNESEKEIPPEYAPRLTTVIEPIKDTVDYETKNVNDEDIELGKKTSELTEEMEIMLDIDTKPEIIEDEMKNDKIPFTPGASIEIIEPSDESLPQSPGPSSFLQIPSEATSERASSLSDYYTDKDRDESVQSRLSFIVREKLHHFASDLRRRTSVLLEDITQDDSDNFSDISEAESTMNNDRDKNASLMSLIGLKEFENINSSIETRHGCLPDNIDPFGKTYLFWLSIVVIAFFYNAFCIPLRCTFPYQTDENLAYWLILDYLCDSIYIIDMIIIKPRLIFMRGGITITDKKELAKHYFVSRQFKLDIFCVLPFDIGYIFVGPIAALRLFRCFKIVAFWEFFDLLDSSFSNPYVIRIARTFCYMIYLIHCNACVYYMLSAWQAFGQLAYKFNGKWYINKWVYNNQGNAYIRCFYFTALIATSTGNNPPPTNTIEYAYMIVSWMMGVFVFAVLLGQIRDIVYNANKNAEEFRTTMDKALTECKRLDLPINVTNKVRSWFMYTWEQQKTLDEKRLVNKLPLKLQTDLALSVHYNTLSKVKMFQDADRALLRDLVLKLKPVIFLPQEMVCQKGDVGKEMYIVNQGILEVVSDAGDKVFATLIEGTAFGEISLLAIGGNNRRTANIRSKGYSTLFVLSKEDLNDVIKDYPEAQQSLKRKARQMLKKDQSKITKSKKDLREEMVKKCEVSTALPTPKLLEAVARLLPKESHVGRQLNNMMNKEYKPRQLKRWSTIPEDFSDTSDTEFQRHLLNIHEKSKSLDDNSVL